MKHTRTTTKTPFYQKLDSKFYRVERRITEQRTTAESGRRNKCIRIMKLNNNNKKNFNRNERNEKLPESNKKREKKIRKEKNKK